MKPHLIESHKIKLFVCDQLSSPADCKARLENTAVTTMKVNVRKFPLDFFVQQKNKKSHCLVRSQQQSSKVKWGVKTSRKIGFSTEDRFKTNQQQGQSSITRWLPRRINLSHEMNIKMNRNQSKKSETHENLLKIKDTQKHLFSSFTKQSQKNQSSSQMYLTFAKFPLQVQNSSKLQIKSEESIQRDEYESMKTRSAKSTGRSLSKQRIKDNLDLYSARKNSEAKISKKLDNPPEIWSARLPKRKNEFCFPGIKLNY